MKKILLFIFQLILIKCQGDCDIACSTCIGPREENLEDTNCITCNTASDYYVVEGQPTFCKNKYLDSNFVKSYYLDETTWRLCDNSCLTCIDNRNNCLECKLGKYKYLSSCVSSCPDNFFISPNNKDCIDTCPPNYYLDFFSKTCLEECPSGTYKNNNLGLCTISTTELYEYEQCDTIINEIIINNMKHFLSESSFIPGRYCYIQVFNALDQYKNQNIAEKKYLSKIFLSTEYLKSDIVVIKVDYNKTYATKPEVNDVKFFLFQKIDDEYINITNILDLKTTKDSNDLIYIEKPFIRLQNIEVYKNKYEVFDMFNARNDIYNNFCKYFLTEYNTDLTYDYRREHYFVNISHLCFNDSTKYYSGFNSKTTSIQCKANYKENKFTGKAKVGDSRFKVFKCTKYLSEDFGLNLGFWIIFLIIIFNFVIGYYFWRAPFKKIINFMQVFEREFNKPTDIILKWTTLSPPKKKMKIIYEPKEFIIDDELKKQENELKYGKYLEQYYKKKQQKLENLQNKEENDKNNNILKSNNSDKEHTSSSKGYTLSYGDISSYKSDNRRSSVIKKKEKLEEEEEKRREKDKRKNEFLNFKEDQYQKEKAIFANNVYKSLMIKKPDLDSIFNDYNERQNKIKEEKKIKTNLLSLDNAGNVVKDPPGGTQDIKYEPKQFLEQYMHHNFEHLLPVPNSERVSSGSLSSDIRNELLKLQQLREKKMVETIFLKRLLYNQNLIKGYNEDFYPFSFDECIIRRKEQVTFLMIFWNYLKEVNLIVNIIYDPNFLENKYLKIVVLGFELFVFIFFNLIFYSDDYINDFYIHKGKYNFFYQLTKSIYSNLCTAVIIKLSMLLISCKTRFRNIIINRKYESDIEYRKDYKFWIKVLTIKIVFFYVILVTWIIIGWVYYMCFSVPYRHSQKFVLVGTIFSLLIHEIFGVGIIALVSRLKYVSIKAQNRRLYNIMMIVNKFL